MRLTIKNRWCTGNLKRTQIEKYKKKYKGCEIVEYVGIAADEPKRVKDKRYPLVEWGVTEKQALEYCYKHGFNWDGLYNHFNRLSCWCCPLSNLKELKILWKDFPKLWNKLKEWEGQSIGQFRTDYSIPELEKKFACEERGEKYKKEKSSVLSK